MAEVITKQHSELPRFQQVQYAFAANLRNPSVAPAQTDIEPRRTQIYQDLFYNNVEGFLANAFPVIRQILTDAHWHGIARDFFANHHCQTPLFYELAQEFLSYLQQHRDGHPADPPFLLELAHYEWVELTLDITPVEDGMIGVNPEGDLLEQTPVLSPVAWPLLYRYPVHEIRPDFQPQVPAEQPVSVLVYRQDDEVQFMKINLLTAALLEMSRDHHHLNGAQMLEQLADSQPQLDRQAVLAGGLQILQQMRQQQVIVGTRSPC